MTSAGRYRSEWEAESDKPLLLLDPLLGFGRVVELLPVERRYVEALQEQLGFGTDLSLSVWRV